MAKPWHWIVITLVSVAWGCTSTPEVRELSRVTAINSGLLTGELQRYAADEKRFAEARRKNVQQLQDTVAAARERYEVDRLLTRKTKGGQFETWEKELSTLIAEIDEVRKQARDNRIVVTAPKPVTVDERVSALAALAKSMSTLAKSNDLKVDLIFLKGYIDSVREQIDPAAKSETPTTALQRQTLSDVKQATNPQEAGEGRAQ